MGKTIISSVGQGGINGSKDAMTIQYLLNCVPANKGGPTTELEVDGVVGPKTIAAIKAFQKANLPFSDGRVDPGKGTLQALQAFDPNPAAPIGVVAPKAADKTAQKLGYKDAASKGYKDAGWKTGYKESGIKTGYKESGVKTGYKDAGYKESGFKTGYKDAAYKTGYKEGPYKDPGYKTGYKAGPSFKDGGMGYKG